MKERVIWVMTVLALLALLAWTAVMEPLLPDEDDCRARGKAADCWKDVQSRR